MDYLYYIANASLTLRIIDRLKQYPYAAGYPSITVVHQINGWVVKIRFERPLANQERGNLHAYLSELGISYNPEVRLQMVFWSLETGQSPIDVMRRYQVAIVSHGSPEMHDIEAFRQQFTRGLGYCPETLA
jgi:hypothetical protein